MHAGLRRLVIGVLPRKHGFDSLSVHMRFFCTNRHWDKFSSSTSVSPLCIIPPLLHNDHSFIFTLTRRASGQMLEISKRNPLLRSAVQERTFISDFEVLFSECNTGWAATQSFTLYSPVVTICTAQWSLYVPHSGHYMYRTVVTICTAQWSLYVPPV